ncbi:uncharacterized protein LOC129586642 [Paramacrobiotus metropolitanus]|uniref:uncharacterized protein LOC129586642 n=1 Tax=Paramacrobiotus metropolitanus TaxID=2943436 RepID=UPI002445F688|nr:uncharacterized protein LOC129586642 [Paramacrobiotus metropolitanus]
MPSISVNVATHQKPKPQAGDGSHALWKSAKAGVCKTREKARRKAIRIFGDNNDSKKTDPSVTQTETAVMPFIPSGVRKCCCVFAECCAWACCVLMVLNIVPLLSLGIWGLKFQSRICSPDVSGRISTGNVSMQVPVEQDDVFKWLDFNPEQKGAAGVLHAWDRPETVLRKLCFAVDCEWEDSHSRLLPPTCKRIIGWQNAWRLWDISIMAIVCGSFQIMGLLLLAVEEVCGSGGVGLWFFMVGFLLSLLYYYLIANDLFIIVKALSW